MKIAVIGSGNIGKSLGSWAAQVGYEVIFCAKNADHAQAAAEAAGHGAQAAPVGEAVSAADMIVLAIPYLAVSGMIGDIAPLLTGKVLIDVTNALKADYSGLAVGLTSSGAEEIAKAAPEAYVVKAFNTVFAPIFAAKNPKIAGRAISVIYAGDDVEAKGKVKTLITSLGFDAIDAGPLSAARNIEPMGMLNIQLGFMQGLGTGIGFSLLR
jgi:predicted dinucleotide-binding enzyme